MSTNGTVPNVSAFVHDLVAMAKASEELPIIKGQLDEAKAESQAHFNMVLDREATLRALQEQLDQVNAKLKATEAERDDAEIRFLELDEKAHTVLGVLDLIAAKSNDAKSALEPVKAPEPEPIPEPVVDTWVPETGPFEVVAEPAPVGESEAFPTTTTEDVGIPVGQSEPDPIASESTSSEASAIESSASSTSDVSSPIPSHTEEIGTGTGNVASGSEPGQSEVPFLQQDILVTSEPSPLESGGIDPAPEPSGSDASKPYEGKKYWLLTNYVSRADWIAGGGAEEDYEWIPERDSAAQ